MRTLRTPLVLAASVILGLTAPSARAEMKLGQERFFGKGTRGPYAISRQAVQARTESVRVNGRHLVRGQDYLFDASLGALSFMEPIRLSDSIDIDYQYDSTVAHAPTASIGTMGLLSGYSGGLALSYAFKPDTSGNQTLSSLGFTGSAAIGRSALTTSFLLDKTAAQDAGVEAQNMLLSMKQETGAFKYDLGYSRVGKQFSLADSMKLVKGSEALNFSGSMALANNGSLSFKKAQNSTPDAKTKIAKETDLLSGALSLNLSSRSKFSALHETQTEAQGTSNKSTSVDRLQLDQNMGRNASASLVSEILSAGANGKDETTKNTRLNLTASGNNALKVESALSLTNNSKTGDSRDMSLKLTQGAGSTKVALNVTDKQADSGDLRTHSLVLNSQQGKGLNVTAAVSGESGSNGTHERTALSMEGGTSDRLRYAMGVANDTGTKKGTSTQLSLSSALANGIKWNAFRSDDGTVKNGASSTKLGMEYTGSKTMKFSASMLENDNGTKSTGNTRMNLEANPSKDTTLVASHVEDVTEKADTSATKVNLNTKAGDNVKVAMSYADTNDGKLVKEASAINVEAAPSTTLKLVANVGQTDDEKGAGQNRAVSVEAKPGTNLQVAVSHFANTNKTGESGANKLSLAAGTERASLTASYADALAPTGASSIRQAGMKLGTTKDKLSLVGSYSNEIKQDKSEIQIALLQAEIKPSSALALSGSFKQRDTGAAEQINTANATLTVKPAESLQVVGTYIANPEEKDKIIRTIRKGLALQTNTGALTLSGGYIRENSLLDAAEGTRAEFKLGLKFNKYANLQGAFEQTIGAVRGYTPLLAYNVKYTHKMGSDFNLLLDANVSHKNDTVPIAQRDEVKATANLGIRF